MCNSAKLPTRSQNTSNADVFTVLDHAPPLVAKDMVDVVHGAVDMHVISSTPQVIPPYHDGIEFVSNFYGTVRCEQDAAHGQRSAVGAIVVKIQHGLAYQVLLQYRPRRDIGSAAIDHSDEQMHAREEALCK